MKPESYYWLSDETYQKLIGQTRMRLHLIWDALRTMGQDVYVDEAINQTLTLIEEFGQKVRGKDIPYSELNYRGRE